MNESDNNVAVVQEHKIYDENNENGITEAYIIHANVPNTDIVNYSLLPPTGDYKSLFVEKSRPILTMATSYSVGELKLLDTYLSRINPRDPNSTRVEFTRIEYQELMNISQGGGVQARIEVLRKYTESLLKKVVTIRLTEDGSYQQLVLFSSVAVYKKNGLWNIQLQCSEEAKKYFFSIEKMGYIRFYLKNVIAIKSKASLLLYYYLLANKFRVKFTVTVDELKQTLGCNETPRYEQFKFFNSEVLKRAVDEINRVTNLRCTYNTSSPTSRVVKSIEFIVVEKNELPSAPAALTDDINIGFLSIYKDVFKTYRFPEEEIIEFINLLRQPGMVDTLELEMAGDSLDVAIFNRFVRIENALANYGMPIGNPYAFVKALIAQNSY